MKKKRFSVLVALAVMASGCSSEEGPASAEGGKPMAKAPEPTPFVLVEPEGNGEPGDLTAFADVDEIIGDAPHRVELDVDVIDGTGNPPFTFKWDFGDATEFSTEKAPSHTYEIPGSFRASVIVTDSKGWIDQDYVDITVNEDLGYELKVTPEQLREAIPLEKLVKGLEEGRGEGAAEAPANEARE